MAAPQPATVGPDTPITVKVSFDGANRRFRLPLREITTADFAGKIREYLQVPTSQKLLIERFSDSSNAFVTLDPANFSSYKQLYRAAKAKSKLRLKVTVSRIEELPSTTSSSKPLPPQPDIESQSAVSKNLSNRSAPEATGSTPVAQAALTATANLVADGVLPIWQICCNRCDIAMPDTHYHCSICDDGDYDLCESCVHKGVLCPGSNHWLIKRNIENGKVVNSSTERLASRPKRQNDNGADVVAPIPGAFDTEPKAAPTVAPLHRTCNACVRALPESVLANCQDCDDFDLCYSCIKANNHGHHPAHTLKPIVDNVQLDEEISRLCLPGRNAIHYAMCDGCDNTICGIRHKCIDCPDWDYCSSCIKDARHAHPRHRFVKVFEPTDIKPSSLTRHYGIYCDGFLCSGKSHQSYIQGVRYKCAICHDTDFCAECEAHPNSNHNATHPLIKFKTHVKNASITTLGEDAVGRPMPSMGDESSALRAKLPAASPPAYSPIHHAANAQTAAVSAPSAPASSMLDAHFIRDRVPDGTRIAQNTIFYQTWTMRNPGPMDWPMGCRVQAVGGDNMMNIDPSRPSTVQALAAAKESNATTAVVRAGEDFNFTILLRSPLREGKHISYWRAKTADGLAFGHKLWCEIEVKAAALLATIAAPASISHPSAQHQGLGRTGRSPPAGSSRPVSLGETTTGARSPSSPNHVRRQVHPTDPTSECLSIEDIRRRIRMHPTLPQINSRVDLAQNEQLGSRPVSDAVSYDAYRAQLMQMEKLNKERLDKARREAMGTHCQQQEMIKAASDRIIAARAAASFQADQSGKAEAREPSTENIESSRMVFPTLEKESPSSSTHEAANELTTEIVASAPTDILKSSTNSEAQPSIDGDVARDFDSVDYEDSGEDEAFLTDEEYDILDASDEEFLSGNGRAA